MLRILLMLTIFCFSAPIAVHSFQLFNKIDIPFIIEISYMASKKRNGTLLNPENDLIKPETQSVESSVEWRPYFSLKNIDITGDIWTSWKYVNGDKPEIKAFFPELTLGYSLNEQFVVTGGISVIQWGTGYIWNPSNPFRDSNRNNIDLARTYKKSGDPLVQLGWSNEDINLTATLIDYLPEERISKESKERRLSGVVRLGYLLDNSDISILAGALKKDPFYSLSFSITASSQLELHSEWSIRRGNPRHFPVLTGSTDTLDAFSFYQLENTKKDGYYNELLLGTQYTTSNLTNIIIEYLYNGTGYSKSDFDQLLSAAEHSRLFIEHPITGKSHRGFLANSNLLPNMMRKNYLFLRISIETLPLYLKAKIYSRLCIDDNSHLNGFLLLYPLNQNSEIKFQLENYSGGSNTEVGMFPSKYNISTSLVINF